jgi:phosphate uptake regulator
MSNLQKLLDRKTAVTARLSRVKSVLSDKGTCLTIGSGLDINVNEQVFRDIMQSLFIHQEECAEELRDIDRKINAINELLGGM